ncbi:MAG: histidine kinase [Lachnospiraceae bacterium]|nr:histidine kinase [Lachnospiraceae bacterium]
MKKVFSKILHKYLYDIRLFYKLLISHGLLILLPTLVLFIFLYNQLYDAIVSDTILSEQNQAGQAATSIESALYQVKETADSLLEEDAANRLFSSYSSAMSDNTLYNRISELSLAANELTDGQLITDIHIYVDDSFLFLVEHDSDNTLFSPLSDVTSTYWYGIFQSQNSSSLFCPSLYLSVTEETTRGSLAYISRVSSSSGGEIYLAVYFSQDYLAALLSSNINLENSAAYILDDRDTVVSVSDSALSGAYYMSNDSLIELIGGVNMYSTRTYLEDSIYVGYFSIPNTDWHLVSILSSRSLVRKGQSLVLQFAGIYISLLVLVLLICMLLSQSTANRISRLNRQMQSVHQGRPTPMDDTTNAHDEIGELISTYNYMSDEINRLLDEQMKAAEDLKLAEFNAFQSQINPHFLYNSLDMINWMAQIGQREQITEAIQALSRFYKLTLSKKNTDGTVGVELEHVSLYVQLQNMRYENKINFLIDVPDTLLDYKMLKLTLQPIVENCIQHGIMEKEEKAGTILITGWLEGDDLILLISDDGVGMSQEQINSILSGTGQKTKGGSNIGIYNTHSRIQLLYGSSYGLSYDSQEGVGTNTQIRIPALHDD